MKGMMRDGFKRGVLKGVGAGLLEGVVSFEGLLEGVIFVRGVFRARGRWRCILTALGGSKVNQEV